MMLFVFANTSQASHLMGGEITWKCVKIGPDAGKYIFTVKVYRDCQGVAISTTMNLDVHNVPGLTIIPLIYLGNNDISPICNITDGANSAFSCGGVNLGSAGNGAGAVEEHIYQSNPIIIPGTPDANGWHFTWSSCCRNSAITNGLANEGFTLRAVIYSYTDSLGTEFPNNNNCYDSSPKFYETPRTILESGNGYDPLAFSNGFTYSHNAFDEERDSLTYEWGQPLGDLGYDYLNPNSSALQINGNFPPHPLLSNFSPIPGIIMNNQTGKTWYPADYVGNFVTCTNVSAYKCGQLVSEVFREIQVVLIPPTCNLGDTTNGNIGADTLCNVRPLVQPPFFFPLGSPQYQWDTIVHCGDTVTFDFVANDYDLYPNGSQQDLQFTVSGGQFMNYNVTPPALCDNPPCATFIETSTGTNPPFITAGGSGSGSFEWITACNQIVNTCGSNLQPSIYTFIIKVQDDFCPAPAIENTAQVISITVCPPCSAMKINASSTIANCGNADGTISVAPTNGFPPYTTYCFDMNGMPVNPNNLLAGDYEVRVRDSSLCETIDTITVAGPPAFSFTTTSVNLNCYGANDASATASITAGVPPYTYLWSNGGTTSIINNLSSGIYNVIVTDSNNCTSSDSVDITEPFQLIIDTSITILTNLNCFGFNDGSIDVSPLGGTPSYTFVWSNGATTEDLTNVGAGTYSVTVSDTNMCSSVSYIYIITQPTQITNTNTVTSVSCNGNADGSIDIFPNGGVSPYTYLWSNGDITEDVNGIAAGSYSLEITDNNGCIYYDTIIMVEPLVLVPSFVLNGSNLSGNSIGGTMPYTFEFWGPSGFLVLSSNNFGTNVSITPIISGNYTFIVVDANGCSDSASIYFSLNFSPTVIVSLSNTYCDSLADLTIEVSQDSGEVDMSTSIFLSTAGAFDISSMSIGNTIGTATLMAAGGSIMINTYLMVSSVINVNQAIICANDTVLGCIGSFTINNNPGSGVYILANTIPDGNNYTLGNMSSVTFVNCFINPCGPFSFNSTINSELGDVYYQSTSFGTTSIEDLSKFNITIHPNPSDGRFTLEMNGVNNERYNVTINSLLGQTVYDKKYSYGSFTEDIDISKFGKGTYLISVSSPSMIITEQLIVK